MKKNGWLTANSLSGSRNRLLVIPGDLPMKMAVTGALEPLTFEQNWEQFGTLTPAECADAMRIMLHDFLIQDEPMFEEQSRVSFWHRWTTPTTGNALQIVVDAAVLWGHYARQNAAAVGDDNMQEVWLSAGTYQIRVLYYRLTNNGNLSIIFQHQPDLGQVTAMNAVSLYGTTLPNQVITGSFTLTQSGHYKVFWQCPSNTSPSTGFALPLTVTEIWKV